MNDPYTEGRQAFKRREAGNRKPYHSNSAEGREWTRGWLDAQAAAATGEEMEAMSEAQIENTPDTSDLQAQITAFITDRLKQLETPYKHLPEDEQRTVIQDAQEAARHFLDQAVKRIAADGRQTIEAEMAKVVNDGKKLQGTLECKTDDQYRHALLDSVEHTVLLVVADAEPYMGGDMPEPDPDQRDLTEAADAPIADQTQAAA